MHQERLAGAQSCPHEDGRPDRTGHLGQRRACHQVDAVGDREQLTRRNNYLLGVAAARHQGQRRIADSPVPDVSADILDDARAFQARIRRRSWRRIIFADSLEQVCTVNRRRRNRQPYLAGTRRPRVGHLRPSQHVRAAGLGDDNGTHIAILADWKEYGY